MNSEQNLTREEAIAILNTPDEQLNELIERAGALRKKYKGNHVSIHLLTNARSGNCSQNCAYCAQSCRSHADIEKYKWVDDEKLYGDNTFVHDHKLSRHCIGLSGMKFSDDEIEELASKIRKMKEEGTHATTFAMLSGSPVYVVFTTSIPNSQALRTQYAIFSHEVLSSVGTLSPFG